MPSCNPACLEPCSLRRSIPLEMCSFARQQTCKFTLASLLSASHDTTQALRAHALAWLQERDPLPAFREFCKTHALLADDDFKAIDDDITRVVDAAVEFADESPRPEKGQLLENVFADPKGFGIDVDGEYRYTKPGFSSGQVDVS